VSEPKIQAPTDAIVRLAASAICGTDLHMVRGTMTMMKPGTILGHEAVGIVEELGPDVRNFRVGDRVVIASTIACGYCSYCRSGYFSQCDNANPNGPQSGTAFFGGPEMTGPFHGLQAERARIPFAKAMNKNLTINMGNCNHRKYIPMLIDTVRSGEVNPAKILTQHEPLGSAIDAYKAFDDRQEGWIKVKLEPVG
jgi:threonine dehydrogenase-like Zn-dependent dehydrogenase